MNNELKQIIQQESEAFWTKFDNEQNGQAFVSGFDITEYMSRFAKEVILSNPRRYGLKCLSLEHVREISIEFLGHYFSSDITPSEAWDVWVSLPQSQEFLRDVEGFYSREQIAAKLQKDFGTGQTGEDWELPNARKVLQQQQTIEELWQEVCELVYKEYNKGREPFRALQNAFTIQRKQPLPQKTPKGKQLLEGIEDDWIPVDKGLPNNHTDVYFVIQLSSGKESVSEGRFYVKDSFDRSNVFISGTGVHFVVGDADSWQVTHWMRKIIPKPPRSKQKT